MDKTSDKLEVFFDESCGICKRVMKLLSVFNYRGQCCFLFAEQMQYHSHPEVMKNRYFDLYSFDGNQFFSGYDTYMQIFKRSLLLMPVYYLMKLSIVRRIGERIYRKVADSRSCKVKIKTT